MSKEDAMGLWKRSNMFYWGPEAGVRYSWRRPLVLDIRSDNHEKFWLSLRFPFGIEFSGGVVKNRDWGRETTRYWLWARVHVELYRFVTINLGLPIWVGGSNETRLEQIHREALKNEDAPVSLLQKDGRRIDKPTIAELEKYIDDEVGVKVSIQPDGSIKEISG